MWCCSSFFFNDPATTEIYTLSLHDALPISLSSELWGNDRLVADSRRHVERVLGTLGDARSEEHTSELQSLRHLVCRLLLEKKKKIIQSQSEPIPTRSERVRPLHLRSTYTRI